MLQLPGWFLRAGRADRSQPLVTESFAPGPLLQEVQAVCDFRVRLGPRIAGKLKRYGTLGLASDPILEEGLSRLRLSGWLRVLFLRKV